MSDSEFLFVRLRNEPKGRAWNGDDEKGKRTWHGFIPKEENPTDITLHWQASRPARLQYIGTYQLNLTELLNAGYIRTKRKGKKDGFEVEFVHAQDDCIYIQKNRRSGSPRLVVGVINGNRPG